MSYLIPNSEIIQNDLSQKQFDLIKKVAKRVSDLNTCKISEGMPCTDGKIIYLPFKDKSLSYYDLEGLAAHEGAHIRFRSIIDPELPQKICPSYPQLGQTVLNIVEDARIEFLLKQTFSGFWDEIDKLNQQNLVKKISLIRADSKNIFEYEEKLIDFLLMLLSLIGTSHKELIFHENLRLGKLFMFGSKHLKYFWEKSFSLFESLFLEPNFGLTVLTSMSIINLMMKLLSINREIEKSKVIDKEQKLLHIDCDENELDKKEKKSIDQNEENHTKKSEMNNKSTFKFNIPENTKLSSIKNNDLNMSGIKIDNCKKSESDLIDNIKITCETSQFSSISDDKQLILEFKQKFSEEFNELNEDLKNTFNKLKATKFIHIRKPIEEQISMEDKDKIKIISYFDSTQISLLNQITNASFEYMQIRAENFSLIYNLRVKFDKIKKSVQLQRGQRIGYISGRDLTQVRASRGQFNRPFKAYNRDKGAQIIILIDESGSMRGHKIKIAKKTAIILSEALKQTKIKFAIIGFAAKYKKHEICEKIYKNMSEDVNIEKVGSIGISNQYFENRDGNSILAIQKYFLKDKKYLPILIILSDGIPHHGGTPYLGGYAIKKTHDSIVELKLNKIKFFTFSIDSAGKDYLQQIYGSQNFFIAKSISDLTPKLLGFVSEIVKELQK